MQNGYDWKKELKEVFFLTDAMQSEYSYQYLEDIIEALLRNAIDEAFDKNSCNNFFGSLLYGSIKTNSYKKKKLYKKYLLTN